MPVNLVFAAARRCAISPTGWAVYLTQPAAQKIGGTIDIAYIVELALPHTRHQLFHHGPAHRRVELSI